MGHGEFNKVKGTGEEKQGEGLGVRGQGTWVWERKKLYNSKTESVKKRGGGDQRDLKNGSKKESRVGKRKNLRKVGTQKRDGRKGLRGHSTRRPLAQLNQRKRICHSR